jgi:integrase
MKNDGLSDYTIRFTSKALKLLTKHTDLDDPETVKAFLVNYQKGNGYRRNLAIAYLHYAKFYGLVWKMPKFRVSSKMPKIPTQEKIDLIILASNLRLATQLSISKECGLRPVEVMGLRVKDVDTEQRLVYPTTAKHGSARLLRISQKTTDSIKAWIDKKQLGSEDRLFNGSSDEYGKQFRHVRDQVAEKTQDPTIKQIRLYDLRHFFATMTYHRTRDILYTKQQMGHKRIETTLVYTQLISFREDDYYSATAKTVEEAKALIEQGFEYVTEMEGTKLFRKRK